MKSIATLASPLQRRFRGDLQNVLSCVDLCHTKSEKNENRKVMEHAKPTGFEQFDETTTESATAHRG